MMSLVNGILFVGAAGTASVKITLYMYMVVHGKRRSSTKFDIIQFYSKDSQAM